jgi:hypothetical protein
MRQNALANVTPVVRRKRGSVNQNPCTVLTLVLASPNFSPAPPPGSGRHVSMLVDFMYTIAALEYRNNVIHNEVNGTPQGGTDIQSVHVQC